jgi:cytochrome c-type biogenesis protein CcmH
LLVAIQLSPALAYDEAEYLKAAETVLCDCGCHPQSVAACACGRAAELRQEMRTMVAGGMSGDDVIASYVAKHGEQILIAPDAEGFNLLAWLGPVALLLAGVVGIVLLVRRWSPKAGSEANEAPRPDLAPDDPYVSKLRRELKDMQ